MGFDANGLYQIEDIAFVNTVQFTEGAKHFKKFGCYTKAPKGTRDHKEFWDIEEDRLKNGMKAPGKLYYENGIPKIQEVHITGEHYGFLNYARIRRTKDDDLNELKNFVTGSGKRTATKGLDFPKFMDGQYHWMKAKEFGRKNGLHIVMAKARRKGFSYMEGWDAALTINMNPFSTVIIGAYDYKYITLGNQMMPMAKSYLDFLELHTDFNRGYLKESVEHIKLGFKKQTTGNIEYGYRSELVAVSFMNNPDAGVGKDAIKIKMEECGKFPNLKDALNVTLPTMKDGSIMTGQLILFGTGGTDDANWKDFEEIYYNPASYDCMAFDNIWDSESRGTGVGFFYPQEVGDPAYIDEHGNSLRKAALAHGDLEREKTKKTKSNGEFIKYIAQEARCPKEAFSSGSDNIFPTAEINEQLARVEHDPDFKYLPRCGQLVRGERGIKFKHNTEIEMVKQRIHEPVFNFPLKSGQDVTGCYVEWISPYRDPTTGLIPSGLYRLWHDPYAHDKDSKNITIRDSLGATYVYERMNNITPGKGDYLVGCYVGRPDRMDDYNENLMKLAEYWNGQIMFENDRGDVKGYFAKHRKLHFLADEPDLEWQVELKGKTNRHKGMNMTEKRKAQAAIYLRDWLMESRGKDAYGNEKLNLHYIYDPAFLRELLKWNTKGNFDRVSSALIGMFDIKECFHKEIKVPRVAQTDNFFNRSLFTNS